MNRNIPPRNRQRKHFNKILRTETAAHRVVLGKWDGLSNQKGFERGVKYLKGTCDIRGVCAPNRLHVQAARVLDGCQRECAMRAGVPYSNFLALGVLDYHHGFVAVVVREGEGFISDVSFERRISESW